MNLILVSIIAIIIISAIILLRYKPVYEVSIAGQQVGFISSKELFESEINDYINTPTGNIAFVELTDNPQYEYKLLSRSEKTTEDEVLDCVKEHSEITYKTYVISIDGEKKTEVATEEEANSIISKVKENTQEGVNIDFGINVEYSTELALNSSEEAIEKINTIKDQKVAEYNEAQRKAAEEAAQKAAAQNAKLFGSYVPTTTLASAGDIGNLHLKAPVSGMISSRFGDRSGVRRYTHTGTDIAAPMGTAVTSAAAGTVAQAGWNGSYGNCIIINHEGGIQTWYAHLSKMNVQVGQHVDTSTIIGNVGSTGNSTGPHLHLEIRINGTPVNPQNFLYN